MEELEGNKAIEDYQKLRLGKHIEKKFPGIHAENIPSLQDTNRELLPKLLK
jgi:hypothetical protein